MSDLPAADINFWLVNIIEGASAVCLTDIPLACVSPRCICYPLMIIEISIKTSSYAICSAAYPFAKRQA